VESAAPHTAAKLEISAPRIAVAITVREWVNWVEGVVVFMLLSWV
jgi:hypothetical protein